MSGIIEMLRWGKTEKERRDELLSAYLDGELSQLERDRLEARLSHEPALRAELRALREVTFAVRDLPQVTVPRNFILTESVVGQRVPAPAPEPRRAWAAPLLTAATVVVSMLFVVVLAGELLLPGTPEFAAAPEPMRQMEEAAPLVIEEGPVPEAEREGPVTPMPDLEIAPEIARRELTPESRLEDDETGLTAAEGTVAAEVSPDAAEVPDPSDETDPALEVDGLAEPEAEVAVPEPLPGEPDVVSPRVPEEDTRGVLAQLPVSRRWMEVALGVATLVLTAVTVLAWRGRLG